MMTHLKAVVHLHNTPSTKFPSRKRWIEYHVTLAKHCEWKSENGDGGVRDASVREVQLKWLSVTFLPVHDANEASVRCNVEVLGKRLYQHRPVVVTALPPDEHAIVLTALPSGKFLRNCRRA